MATAPVCDGPTTSFSCFFFFIFFLFIPKCFCSLPIYLLSLGGLSFLSSLSVYSFISFIVVFLSSPPILHFLIILLFTLRTPLIIIHITLIILVTFPQATLHIHPLLSLLHRPTPPAADTLPSLLQSIVSINTCTASTRWLFPTSCFSATLSCCSHSLRSHLQSSFTLWVTLTLSHFLLDPAPVFPPVGSMFSPAGGILGCSQHCFRL